MVLSFIILAFVLYYEYSCGKPRSGRRIGHGFEEGEYRVNDLTIWPCLRRLQRSEAIVVLRVRTLGHGAGISAGLDAVGIDILDPNRAGRWHISCRKKFRM